jgi:ankyrin repeat protein
VKLLLEKGADINAGGGWAIRASAQMGHLEVVKLLLEKGAYINAGDGAALRASAQMGHLEVVKLLLEQGADIHRRNDEALRVSAQMGHIKVVKLLLEQGATAPADFAHNNLLDDSEVQAKRAFISKFNNFNLARKAINDNMMIQFEHYYEQFLQKQKIVHSDDSVKQFEQHCSHLHEFYHTNHDERKEEFIAFKMGFHPRLGNESKIQDLHIDTTEIIWNKLLPFSEDREMHRDILGSLEKIDQSIHDLFVA